MWNPISTLKTLVWGPHVLFCSSYFLTPTMFFIITFVFFCLLEHFFVMQCACFISPKTVLLSMIFIKPICVFSYVICCFVTPNSWFGSLVFFAICFFFRLNLKKHYALHSSVVSSLYCVYVPRAHSQAPPSQHWNLLRLQVDIPNNFHISPSFPIDAQVTRWVDEVDA